MGFEEIPFTKNRSLIYDMLTRSKRFHCSVSGNYEFDITDTLQRIEEKKQAGKDVGLTALLVHATSQILEQFPRLNHHLFHDFLGRKKEVAFDHISCTLIVQRTNEKGEDILIPLLLRNSNKMSIAEIHQSIRHHKKSPLNELPQAASLEKLKKTPLWALKYFSYKARSDPKFYERRFGTYGLSSLTAHGWGGIAGSAVANVASAFFPATIQERPKVIEGEVKARTVLTMGIVADHYIVDGMDIVRAMDVLRSLIEEPELS